jgi:hypothetical protein
MRIVLLLLALATLPGCDKRIHEAKAPIDWAAGR